MMTGWLFKGSEKKRLRNEMKQLRGAMITQEVEQKSHLVAKNLKQTAEYMDAKNILFYASKGNEVQTDAIIKDAMKGRKRVLLPITNTAAGELEVSEIKDYPQGLGKGPYYIREPKAKIPFPENELDAVIVPGLAFSQEGFRLGYGLGFYDKLLARLKESGINTRMIGLAYDFQFVDKIPREKHDQPMDVVVTESRIARVEGRANGRKPER